jgi:hypothetical protein
VAHVEELLEVLMHGDGATATAKATEGVFVRCVTCLQTLAPEGLYCKVREGCCGGGDGDDDQIEGE